MTDKQIGVIPENPSRGYGGQLSLQAFPSYLDWRAKVDRLTGPEGYLRGRNLRVSSAGFCLGGEDLPQLGQSLDGIVIIRCLTEVPKLGAFRKSVTYPLVVVQTPEKVSFESLKRGETLDTLALNIDLVAFDPRRESPLPTDVLNIYGGEVFDEDPEELASFFGHLVSLGQIKYEKMSRDKPSAVISPAEGFDALGRHNFPKITSDFANLVDSASSKDGYRIIRKQRLESVPGQAYITRALELMAQCPSLSGCQLKQYRMKLVEQIFAGCKPGDLRPEHREFVTAALLSTLSSEVRG